MSDFERDLRKGIFCAELADTMKLAADFVASFLNAREDEIIITLSGDLGAGKTAFVKGLARALGVEQTVKSPSFNICCVYDTPDSRKLVHIDAYRLSDPNAYDDLLIEEIAPSPRIVCVEWPEMVGDFANALNLKLEIVGESRLIRLVD